jgi:hypothetical protein
MVDFVMHKKQADAEKKENNVFAFFFYVYVGDDSRLSVHNNIK